MPTKKMKDHNEDIVVILEDSCDTVSGKSKLVFNLGRDAGDQLLIRIKSNTGAGYFDDSWLPINSILDLLAKFDSDDGFSSHAISGLTRGRSANTPAFLAGVLKELGIIKPLERNSRRYELGDVKGFLSQAAQLQTSKASEKKPARKKPKPKSKTLATATAETTRKPPHKSPAQPRKGK